MSYTMNKGMGQVHECGKAKKTKIACIRFSPEQWKRLEAKATAERRSVSDYIRLLIEGHFS